MKKTIYESIGILFALAAVTVLQLSPTDLHGQNAGKRASLWRTNSRFATMFSDPRARGINDIVTIQISESSTASNKAELTTSKSTKMSMGVDNFLGFETDLAPKINENLQSDKMFGATTSNSNAGEGESTRETSLSAYISARVTDLLPNGNMVIEAKKEVIVNKEKQIAVLRGIIRPTDIEYGNIIASNKIADMQIQFNGKGPVSSQTRQGWLSWLLTTIWPF